MNNDLERTVLTMVGERNILDVTFRDPTGRKSGSELRTVESTYNTK